MVTYRNYRCGDYLGAPCTPEITVTPSRSLRIQSLIQRTFVHFQICVNKLIRLRKRRRSGGGSDIMARLVPRAAWLQGSEAHQKGLESRTADLPNVNCHLTRRPTARLPAAGQGWRGNLIKGSPLTKEPPLLLASPRRQAEARGREMGPALCSQEG